MLLGGELFAFLLLSAKCFFFLPVLFALPFVTHNPSFDAEKVADYRCTRLIFVPILVHLMYIELGTQKYRHINLEPKQPNFQRRLLCDTWFTRSVGAGLLPPLISYLAALAPRGGCCSWVNTPHIK